MKKYIIIFLLFISNVISAQYDLTLKVGLARDIHNVYIPTIDFGQIANNKYYVITDISFPISSSMPGYISFGIGPIIKEKFYIVPFIGIYSPSRESLKTNMGIEIGIINKNIIVSTFINNNSVIGLKFGYKLKNNESSH